MGITFIMMLIMFEVGESARCPASLTVIPSFSEQVFGMQRVVGIMKHVIKRQMIAALVTVLT